MWVRNFLFIALVLGGFIALTSSLVPPRLAPPVARALDDTPAAPVPPVVEQVNRAFHDRWDHYYQDRKLNRADPAPDLAVARRLSLALTGSIPSLQEIREFEALPPSRRLDDWIDHLLNDRRFGDYFAERLARAYVGTEDGPFIVFRRRRFVSWLSDELMRNRPYDQLVRELIAGRGLWTDNPAVNFITATFDGEKKTIDPERLAARVARAFLGVRLDCAQCHDHPFQPWKQHDFQGIAAHFGQTHQGFTGIYDGKGEFKYDKYKTGDAVVVEPRLPFLAELAPDTGARRQQLARWVTDPNNAYFPRVTVNRVWALMFGRPLVAPVDDLGSAPELPLELTLLADDFVAHGYDLHRLIKTIAATEVFRLDSALPDAEAGDDHDRAWAVFPLTRLRPEQVVGGILQASTVQTIDGDSHFLVRAGRFFGEKEFVERYGDTGEDEFQDRSGTIPQRLLMMNGKLVSEKTKEDLFNAASRIALLAPDDRAAIETAYLIVLTRRPTPEEAAYFQERLAGIRGPERGRRIGDLCWTLLNATEFSWNH